MQVSLGVMVVMVEQENVDFEPVVIGREGYLMLQETYS